MADNIYTYVVNHGDKAPKVGGADTYNGDPIIGVCFADVLERNQKAEVLIESLSEEINELGMWSVDEFKEKAGELINQIQQLI